MTTKEWGVVLSDVISSLDMKHLSPEEYAKIREKWQEEIDRSMSGLILVWPQEREYVFFKKEGK